MYSSSEQQLVAFEQFLQGIEKKAFAEPARAGQKVVFALLDHLLSYRRFIRRSSSRPHAFR